ncbi:disease resistance protein RGA2-like [Salvia hispanica]|uniref:disease resistance protein RGA2-like n=1 Tax=Salvia hispanica TaxID=49212 RepID=UPI00200920E8|nr:disease resistance protein RGA2-like [Salvia hispanica]
MEGEAAAAVLQVLVQNLIDHSKKEFSLVRGLKKEAAKLTDRLGTLQQFLKDAEMRTIPGGSVKRWLKRLENVAFDADNVLDEFNYHLLCKQIKPIMPNEPIKPMKHKVLSCFSSPCVKYSRSRNMALRIQEINENLEVINKEAADLGLKEMLATNVPTLPDVSRETDSFTLDPIFIGRDEEVSKVVEIVMTSVTTDERVSIHAIVGMGGLGKTTLTRKVFHLLKEKNLFGSYIWVHVSQIFDPMALLKKILKELAPHKIETEMSKQDTMKKLEESLKEETYLLILDDVWNQDRPAWDGFIQSLLGVSSIKGNVIVVTTRIKEVASTVSPHCPHELKELCEEDCLSIIKEKSFGKKDFPLEFEAIGRKIAKRCKGLPLAANVVGGVLRNKTKAKWISIEQKWLAHNEGAHITDILRLSYDELSVPSLKKCFAYCSVFPKGHGFGKQELVEYWMAEGFLEVDGNNDLEVVGENFFNILLDNSLLQITRRYNDRVECVMHDLLHDLAYSILGGSQDASDIVPVRYMSLEDKVQMSPCFNFWKLSSLEILECPNLRGLPDGLCTLKSLEKLIIRDCPNLEHMGVQQSEGSITLTCLKELEIEECNALVYLPCELLGSSLETLRLVNLSSLKNVAEIIDCLPKLARLTRLKILGFPRFLAFNYYRGNHILELDFSVMGSMETVDGILQGCNFSSIRGLELKGREGWKNLPEIWN